MLIEHEAVIRDEHGQSCGTLTICGDQTVPITKFTGSVVDRALILDWPSGVTGMVTVSFRYQCDPERLFSKNLRPRPDPRKLREQRKAFQSGQVAKFRGTQW